MASVPHADQIEGAREHARLEDTEEESCSEESRVVLDKALEHSDCVCLAVMPLEESRDTAYDVPNPKPNMQIDSHTLGFKYLRTTFEGISNRMYGTKKMTKALL